LTLPLSQLQIGSWLAIHGVFKVGVLFVLHHRQSHGPGVKEIAPSHCTGDKAISLFHQVWGDDFIEGGCGAIIEVPPSVVR